MVDANVVETIMQAMYYFAMYKDVIIDQIHGG